MSSIRHKSVFLCLRKNSHVTIIVVVLFTLLEVSNSRSNDLDRILDVFSSRYKDYPQLYQDMAFIVGNWDFLEAKLRGEMVEVFNKQYRVYAGETAVGQSIVDVCNRRFLPYNMKYTFHVIDLPGINAFAIPGGGVYITKDFINKISQSSNPEAQLAFVFGHEVAHITQRHWISSLKKQYTAEFWQWAAAELSRKGNTELLRQIIPPILEAVFAGYSRQHEHEADSLGIDFMVRAGFNIKGAVDALEMLAKSGSSEYSFWSSHPQIADRIAFTKHMKSQQERQMQDELRQTIERCDSGSGAVSIQILQPRGYFSGIGSETVFDKYAILFFNEEKVREALAAERQFEVSAFNTSKPGQYHLVLPVGEYVLFYKVKSMKQWVTPYKVVPKGWGPLRINVRPRTISYITMSPDGASAQGYECDWAPGGPRSSIDPESLERFVLEESPKDSFYINFRSLPAARPTKHNIEVSGSASITEDKGRVILNNDGSVLMGKFNIRKGTPSEARLTVVCSALVDDFSKPPCLTIKVNGRLLVADQAFSSSSRIAYAWDVAEYLQGGDNTVSLEKSRGLQGLAVYEFSIEAFGAGLGSFYEIGGNP